MAVSNINHNTPLNLKYPLQRKVRLIVGEDVKAQVVNTTNEKVVREIPNETTSQILLKLYA